ncbi:hypothetical protein LTR36_007820 [Oleoguttula mirabilis]|uniref:Thiolase-like protein type 1 additional C-terminal domain-containing protein n=1 Tax=Oleoguttula mirabilis TaxID=1507867 RepID=A0AAV9JAA1_9PEZI|nr:hypothetical protein LTR36_007820 [Oleoguttula mirabilis]
MAPPPTTPVVIGVGDVVNRSKKIENAIEPLQLMLQAIQKALQDAGLESAATAALQSEIDSIDVVKTWTWPYPDLPGLIAERLVVQPTWKHYSEHGGNQPAHLFDEAARRISKGESKVAVVTGGEALASLSACAAAKRLPPPNWTPLNEEVNGVFSPTTRELPSSALPGAWRPPRSGSDKVDLGATHSIGNPIHIYPLYENAFRAHRGQSIEENNAESAQLYAEFAKVAEGNDYAWSKDGPVETMESIGTVTKKNRMICSPYPLLMNAFNTVNLAAACILTSAQHARELGIPEDRWIYALGGAGTRDSNDCLEACGLKKEDIDLYDFYSCFPIVPKLACQHLGLPVTGSPKPISLLGGLTSFGGAGNNYSMHAITEMVRQLRTGESKTGLVLANGGVFTYQNTLCLSSSPRSDGVPYPDRNPLPEIVTDVQVPIVEETAEGDATIETYTVEFSRDGSPLRGYVVGRLKANGHRFIANHADARTLQELCSGEIEQVGRSGQVRPAGDGRNVFTFGHEMAKL